MIYLSGKVRRTLQLSPDMGFMMTPASGARDTYRAPWAADNGCFTLGERFVLEHFLNWLELMDWQRSSCLFAVVPDVVGNAEATLERFANLRHYVGSCGYPLAFAGQDGQQHLPVPWDQFDVLFIGGSTEWKLSEHAFRLAAEAKCRGKWVHMGRVNSRQRLAAAHAAGFDSADGTFIRYRPDVYAERIRRWLGELNPQLGLWNGGGVQ